MRLLIGEQITFVDTIKECFNIIIVYVRTVVNNKTDWLPLPYTCIDRPRSLLCDPIYHECYFTFRHISILAVDHLYRTDQLYNVMHCLS